jgi:hypothetical protein
MPIELPNTREYLYSKAAANRQTTAAGCDLEAPGIRPTHSDCIILTIRRDIPDEFLELVILERISPGPVLWKTVNDNIRVQKQQLFPVARGCERA